jgi:hypothetical protein
LAGTGMFGSLNEWPELIRTWRERRVHIILVSDRLATARSITLTWRHVLMFMGAMFASVLFLSSLFSYVTVRHAAEIRLPFLQDLLRSVNAEESERSKDFVRENLNAMAVKLGEMQAQLLRLDTIGERLAGIAGVRPQELKAFESKGRRTRRPAVAADRDDVDRAAAGGGCPGDPGRSKVRRDFDDRVADAGRAHPQEPAAHQPAG